MDDDELEDTVPYEEYDIAKSKNEIGRTMAIRGNIRPPQTEMLEQMKKDNGISDMWESVLERLGQGDVQGAFEATLNSGDDLYLLRLMAKTGACLNELDRKIAVKLMCRITKILSCKFLEKISLGFFEECIDLNLYENFNLEDQNLLSKILYDMSSNDNKIGEQAANLYSIVLTSMKN